MKCVYDQWRSGHAIEIAVRWPVLNQRPLMRIEMGSPLWATKYSRCLEAESVLERAHGTNECDGARTLQHTLCRPLLPNEISAEVAQRAASDFRQRSGSGTARWVENEARVCYPTPNGWPNASITRKQAGWWEELSVCRLVLDREAGQDSVVRTPVTCVQGCRDAALRGNHRNSPGPALEET